MTWGVHIYHLVVDVTNAVLTQDGQPNIYVVVIFEGVVLLASRQHNKLGLRMRLCEVINCYLQPGGKLKQEKVDWYVINGNRQNEILTLFIGSRFL